MNKKFPLLIIAVLLLLLSPAFSQPPFLKPIHVDPYSIVDIYQPSPAFLFYYDEYLRHLVEGRHFNASRILEILRNVGGPNQITVLLNRTNSIARHTLRLINDVEEDFDKAEKAILEKDLLLADKYLLDARGKLNEVKEAIEELERGLNGLTRSLGVSISLWAPRLNALKEKYKELEMRYVDLVFLAKGGKLGTLLSVYVEPNPVSVGDEVKIYGFLRTENGTFLGGREVHISIDKKGERKVVTDSSGFYILRERIWVYKREIEIAVTYSPKIEEGLAPCINTTKLNVTFTSSRVSVTTKPIATPGSVIRLNLYVSPVGDGRDLNIMFDDVNIISIKVEKPSTSVEYRIPENTALGVHVIEAYLKPKGVYAPAYSKTTVTVTLLPLDVSVEMPKTIIYPLSALRVHGKVICNNTPVQEANVTLYRDGVKVASTLTGDDGSFLLVSNYSSWLPIVETTYKIVVKPSSSKLSSYSFEAVVEEVNLIPFIVIVLALFLFLKSNLSSSIMRRFRRLLIFSTEIPVSFGGISDVIRERASGVKEAISQRMHLFKKRRVIAKAKYRGKMGLGYWIYLNILVHFSMILTPIKKSETFREYIRRIANRLGENTKGALAQLTILAEAERYGGKKVDARAVEELAEEIFDEFEQ